MKKNHKTFGLFILFLLLFTIKVSAANLSVDKTTVNVGDTVTATVKLTAAAWNVKITAGSGLETSSPTHYADSSETADNVTKSFKVVYKATKVGNVNIKLSGDITDESSSKATPVTDSKIITVVEKVSTNNNGTNSSVATSKTTTAKTTSNTKKTNSTASETLKEESEKTEETNQEEEKHLLKSLEIEGEEIIPEFGSEIFEYTVNIKDKEQLNINAKANKEGLIVEIIGNENLQFGENNIIINLKGQDDKEITSYRINVIKEKSELTLANEKIQKLEKLNRIFIGIIVLLIILIITIVIIYSVIIRKYKNKIDGTSIDSNKKEE